MQVSRGHTLGDTVLSPIQRVVVVVIVVAAGGYVLLFRRQLTAADLVYMLVGQRNGRLIACKQVSRRLSV